MRKILLGALLSLGLAANAQEVRMGGDGTVNEVSGKVMFNLELASSYIYKLKNEKMASSIGTPAIWTAADASEQGIDLGKITSGINTAVACSALVGLTQVADLEVAAALDAETALTDVADSAQCDINVPSAGVKRLRMAIPFAEQLQIAGNGSMDVAYSVAQTSGEEFDVFQIEDGSGASADLAVAPVAAAAKSALPSGHQDQMRIRLEASIAGPLTKTNYSAELNIALTPTLN